MTTLRRAGALVLPLLLLLPGCKQQEKQIPGTPPLPDSAVAITAAQRIRPPQLGGGCYSPPVRTVFHDPAEWNQWWTSENPECARPRPPQIDFAREMLVYAAIGKRMSAQDSISIDATLQRNDSLIIVVRRYLLKDGCPSPAVETFPQSLVKVPATTRPVRFSEAHVTIACE